MQKFLKYLSYIFILIIILVISLLMVVGPQGSETISLLFFIFSIIFIKKIHRIFYKLFTPDRENFSFPYCIKFFALKFFMVGIFLSLFYEIKKISILGGLKYCFWDTCGPIDDFFSIVIFILTFFILPIIFSGIGFIFGIISYLPIKSSFKGLNNQKDISVDSNRNK